MQISDLCSESNESSGKCPKCGGSGRELILLSNDYTKAVYGDDRLIEYAVPCTYCNGGHAEKVKETKKNASVPSSFYESTLKDFKWDIYRDGQQRIVDMSKHKEIVTAFIDEYATFEKYGVGLYIHSKMKGSGKRFLHHASAMN